MARRRQYTTALIMVSPGKARRRILAAFQRARGNYTRTAVVLGCSRMTLWRWIGALQMKSEMEGVLARIVEEEHLTRQEVAS